ncbi:MAG TPA: hypothetical protein VFT43_09205 [Candidatus Polarisedimenticolia bacterium]|nr:hypothetical protein [Candidatus Polarisedimenticolia bacterium]
MIDRGRLLALTALAMILAGAAPAPTFDPTQSDPRAIAVADQVLQALGGQKAWDDTRFLRFSFVVEEAGKQVASRTHLWDRWGGRLRYEKTDKDGSRCVVLLDINARTGSAWRGGVRLEQEEARPLLDEAYEAFINDTYWLLMPYKMKDPGVRLQYEGEVSRGGATYDRVMLSFKGVGLTPGDRYWADVNRVTHRMERWSYVLQDQPPGATPTAWEWKGWAPYGRILLAPEKVGLGREAGSRILHPVLAVYDSLPDEFFSRPDPLPEPLPSAPSGPAR